MMISTNAMQPTLPIKEPTEAQKTREEEGRDFSGSLAYTIGKPLNISAQSSKRQRAETFPFP